MQQYKNKNPAAKSSAAEILNIKNLDEGENICRKVITAKLRRLSVQQ